MGRVGYDSILGLMRVHAAGQREVDRFTIDVLTFHAAIEVEMDHFLSKALPRAGMLTGGRLGFQQKIAVVSAAWLGDPKKGDKLHLALLRFNDLRNSVAHGDKPKEIRKHFDNLVRAVAAFDPSLPEAVESRDLAISICAFMGDVLIKRRLWAEGDEEESDG